MRGFNTMHGTRFRYDWDKPNEEMPVVEHFFWCGVAIGAAIEGVVVLVVLVAIEWL